MVRLKLTMELSYLGTRYVGWQPQSVSQAVTQVKQEEGSQLADTLPGPCRNFNRGRCQRGDGCRSAHICSKCWKVDGSRLSHSLSEGVCQTVGSCIVGEISIQEAIEASLRKAFSASEAVRALLKAPPSGLVASGRTDRGVHASQMLAYCNCHVNGEVQDMQLQDIASVLHSGLQEHLPNDICCKSVDCIRDLQYWPRDHGQKTYAYYILEGPPGTKENFGNLADAIWIIEGLPLMQLETMRESAIALIGEHDFAAFSSIAAGTRDTVRTIFDVSLCSPVRHSRFSLLKKCFLLGHAVDTQDCPVCTCNGLESGDALKTESVQEVPIRLTIFRIIGHGFLKHMVRRILGQLVEIGHCQSPVSRIIELLQPPHQPTLQARHGVGRNGEILGDVNSVADDREMSGKLPNVTKAPKAPACGLWLEAVECMASNSVAKYPSRKTSGKHPSSWDIAPEKAELNILDEPAVSE